jgi:hypothetical protein|tara:strand:+ start:189 stop:326 length:138 start_codon:yes stop_codon:yes gene_type:complete
MKKISQEIDFKKLRNDKIDLGIDQMSTEALKIHEIDIGGLPLQET